MAYNLRFYTKRRGHDDVYIFESNAQGRRFSGPGGFSGLVNPYGKLLTPHDEVMLEDASIYRHFRQDGVCYPNDFGSLLGYIYAKIGQVSDEEIQILFNELGEFISLIERHKPDWDYIPEE